MRTGKELRAEEMNMVNGGLIRIFDSFIKVYRDDTKQDIAKFKFKDDFSDQLTKAIECANENHVKTKYEFCTTKSEFEFLVEHCAQ